MRSVVGTGQRGRGRARAVGVAVLAVAVGLGVAACGTRARTPLADDQMSGFLDDYSPLAPGGPEQPTFVYRDPDVRWDAYDRILFEPVTIWRSGKDSLAAIPPADLDRLARALHESVRAQLARSFAIVQQPGPGTLRIRLALTQARQSDPLLDIFTDAVEPGAELPADAPLGDATREFVAHAAIEGEISDAGSGRTLAAGVDRRRARELRTWGDVRAGADRWAAWFAGRLAQARGAAPSR